MTRGAVRRARRRVEARRALGCGLILGVSQQWVSSGLTRVPRAQTLGRFAPAQVKAQVESMFGGAELIESHEMRYKFSIDPESVSPASASCGSANAKRSGPL